MTIMHADRLQAWLLRPWPSPVATVARVARQLESEGWDGLLLADAQHVGPDPFVTLGVAAASTSSLGLGTGVTNPVTRLPAVLATAIITVQALSGGRAVLGLGRGDGALAPLGMGPMPVDEFEVQLDRLRGYLRGDAVECDGVSSRLLYLDGEAIPTVPVDVAATGPRMLRLAAVKADMVSCAVGALIERARYCRDVVRSARMDAGLDPDSVLLSAYVPIAVTGELDRRQARDTIRASASIFARFLAMDGRVHSSAAHAEDGILHRMADRYEGPSGHPTFSTASVIDDDEFLDRFAVIGTPSACAERLRELVELGYRRLILVTRSLDTDREDRMSSLVAEQVLPLLR